ncbi:hypothetical protein NT04LM_3879, partial [Listeria monocytogenes FSL F2-208]
LNYPYQVLYCYCRNGGRQTLNHLSSERYDVALFL